MPKDTRSVEKQLVKLTVFPDAAITHVAVLKEAVTMPTVVNVVVGGKVIEM